MQTTAIESASHRYQRLLFLKEGQNLEQSPLEGYFEDPNRKKSYREEQGSESRKNLTLLEKLVFFS